MKRLRPVGRLLSHVRLRHPGLRARIYGSLIIAVLVTAPVVLQSLFYIARLGESVERLEDQGARVHRLLTDLHEGAREGGVEDLRRQLAEIDARLLGMEAARSEALATLRDSRRNVLTVLILTSATLLLLLWLLPRRVVAPLRRLLNVLRRAAEGDYAAQARLEAPDEIGEMAREVNRLLGRVDGAIESREALIRSVRHDLAVFGRSVPQAICLIDPERRVVWANEAFERLVGAEEEPTSRPVSDLVEGPAFEDRLKQAFGGGAEEGEVELVLSDESRLTRWMYTAAGYDPRGSVDRVAVVLAEGPRTAPTQAGHPRA